MTIVVQKYGGTSVADPDRIRAVADRVVRTRSQGHDVVVVVSAMGDSTDELMAMARQIAPIPNARELDLLLTAGERIAMSLLSIAINPRRIRDAMAAGNVVIVAGFQGVSTAYDVTTLGRGGSDTTAVALAAALGAERCEIYTDVDGVFTADPRVVPDARRLHAVSHEEMLEMAASGAKVLQVRSVEVARNHGVKLHVRSTFSAADGTWIREEDERMLEKALISGVTHTLEETLYRVEGTNPARLFAVLAEAGVN